MYGAGAPKLARELGIPESQGQSVKDDFYKAHPAIKALIDLLEQSYNRNSGWIKGIDGRPLYIRKKNALLNTLLQNAAAVVFKKWMLKCNKDAPAHVKQIIAYHDETQWDCSGSKHQAEQWGKYMEKLAVATGEEMNLEVPIEAEAKVGKTWFHTH